MTPIVRFAPSPTGCLHVGNLRGALFNWLFARKHEGTYILRLDDTDRERSRDEYAQAIQCDLQWLGLNYDHVFKQSDRLERYDAAIEKLKSQGRLYACYETPKELGFKRKRQLARGQPPLYDRAGLHLSQAEKDKLESEGRRPHWRFLLNPTPIEWNDLIRGSIAFEGSNLSDPVLIREDKTPIYMLSSVVDDLDYQITHIIRGEDHVANTALQIQLIEALDGAPSSLRFAHFPWLLDAEGGGFSKRLGSLSVRDLRDKGIESMAINSLLAKLGTSDPVTAVHSLESLVEQFDLTKITRSPARFSEDALQKLNAKYLHDMPYAEATQRFKDKGLDVPEKFWNAINGNLERFDDAVAWWNLCCSPIAPLIEDEDKDYLTQALTHLPPEPWDESTWRAWTEILKQRTGRSGKSLYKPLRLALTSQPQGPEMQLLLPFIGYARAKRRLQGEQA